MGLISSAKSNFNKLKLLWIPEGENPYFQLEKWDEKTTDAGFVWKITKLGRGEYESKWWKKLTAVVEFIDDSWEKTIRTVSCNNVSRSILLWILNLDKEQMRKDVIISVYEKEKDWKIYKNGSICSDSIGRDNRVWRKLAIEEQKKLIEREETKKWVQLYYDKLDEYILSELVKMNDENKDIFEENYVNSTIWSNESKENVVKKSVVKDNKEELDDLPF